MASFDCVATCFFIDTAHNIIDYLEVIYNCLKPGGVSRTTRRAAWIGPLAELPQSVPGVGQSGPAAVSLGGRAHVPERRRAVHRAEPR